MSMLKQIEKELIEALKAGDKLKVSVLRGLKSDIKYREIATGSPLKDEEVLSVLDSAAKKRKESIEQFLSGGRPELADKETSELEIICNYLPQQLSEEELRVAVRAAIEKAGVASLDQIGLVMKVLMPEIKGKADGKLANRLAREMLAN